jgi:hypothetical protein
VLPGRFDDRGGGAGLAREIFGVTGSAGIGERVTERAGGSGVEGIERDDVGWGVREREMEGPRVGARKVVEITEVSLMWGF